METKKSKIVSVSLPTESKKPGTFYSFVKVENGDSGAVFFTTTEFKYKIGEEIEYLLEESNGRKRLKMATEIKSKQQWTKKTNNKLEALKLAISSFNAGKIEKKNIKPMANYLEKILSE